MSMIDIQVSSPELIKRFCGRCCKWAGVSASAAVFCLSMMSTAVMAQDDDEDAPRPPPETRSANTLSRTVYTRIEDAQEARDAEDYPAALEELNELREMYNEDRLSPYEGFMMWQFFASIAMDQENYGESIDYWQNALEIASAELGVDQAATVHLVLGQLLYREERIPEAIEHLLTYMEIAPDPNNDVWNLLATAYYVQENYAEALPYLLEYMERERAAGETIQENTYGLLVALYFSLEDYPNLRQTLREMIVLFDPDDSWTQLAGVEAEMENFDNQAYTYYLANLKGNLDASGELMTLGYLLFNNDNPYGAAELIASGMENGVIEEDADNLAFLSQAYQVAREDAKAVDPLVRAAEMAGDAEMYYRLGRIYLAMQEWSDATQAFQRALDIGGVEREDQVLEMKANAHMQLHEYDQAQAAAEGMARYSEGADRSENWLTIIENDRNRWETLQRRREELAEWL